MRTLAVPRLSSALALGLDAQYFARTYTKEPTILFRIFRYLTFRTAFASLTALLIALLIGPYVIQKLREFQIGQYIREEGPQAHQKKAGTPTMGGVLIGIAILIPTLLWADLSNRFVWMAIFATICFGAIGFAAFPPSASSHSSGSDTYGSTWSAERLTK